MSQPWTVWTPRQSEVCRGCGRTFTPTNNTPDGFCQICEDEPSDGANYMIWDD